MYYNINYFITFAYIFYLMFDQLFLEFIVSIYSIPDTNNDTNNIVSIRIHDLNRV